MTALQPEPWLRGTLTDVPAVIRAVLHALQLAKEDLHRWCRDLNEEQANRNIGGIPSVAFQLRHIGGSIDRLLTYAEGNLLSPEQMSALRAESESTTTVAALLEQLDQDLDRAESRVRAFANADLEAPRAVGKKQLPTTVGGLLVHVADHTQRHVGQAITTAQVVRQT